MRAIGREPSDRGGVPLMRATLHRAEALSRERRGTTILRTVEVARDGIGDWLG